MPSIVPLMSSAPHRWRAVRVITVLTLAIASILTFQGQGASARYRGLVSGDLLAYEARQAGGRVRVIVHGSPDEIRDLAERHQLTVVRTLADSAVVGANSAEITALAGDPLVHHLSGDLPVRSEMSVSSRSTAADQVRAGSGGLLGSIPGVTGQGIGIALLDSGVSSHTALKNVVAANVSFVTGSAGVADAFGHGTHVAGILAGSATAGAKVTSLFTGGIAPDAKIINVRVLGPNGSGLTSDVIAGMEWVIANRAKYNVRVMNLSLGHPVTEPCATDPLCQAVAKATAAGIVVVTSAGNAGRSPDGKRTMLGGISSPGNSPFAITVGALNSWQTVDRYDDSVTTYSSRGPTRYDLIVKPDIVAPGNKIVSLEASASYLSRTYPQLHIAGQSTNAYMRLSGTSMATPMVSGAIALLLQGDPNLSIGQLKLALQTGATYLPEAGLMAGGAGSVNFWASRKVTANGLSSLLTTLGALGAPSGAAFWDAGTLSKRLYAKTGVRLLGPLDLALVWSNPSLLKFGDLNLVGLLNPLAIVPAKPLQWGQVATWTKSEQILWGDNIYDPQGQQILWGDSRTTYDYQILWGDAVLTASDPE